MLRIEDTDEARNRPEWTQGIIDRPGMDRHRRRRPGTSRARTSRATTPTPTSPPRRGCSKRGHAYYCDLTSRADPASGRRRAAGPATTGTRAIAGSGPGRAACCGSACPTRQRRSSTTSSAATVDVRQRRRSRTSCCCAATARRCSCSPTSSTTSRWASPTCMRGRGAPAQHAQAAAALGGARRTTPPVWAHVPVLVNEQRKKLSKRRDKVALEQYRDEGYLADAMVNYLMTLGWAPHQGDDRDRAVVEIDGAVPARGRHPLAGVLRPQEARRVQRRVHPQAVARRRSSTRVRAVAAGRTTTAAVFARDGRRCVQTRVVTLAEVPRRWSTSCSSTSRPIDRGVVAQGDAATVVASVLADDGRGVRRRARGTPTR